MLGLGLILGSITHLRLLDFSTLQLICKMGVLETSENYCQVGYYFQQKNYYSSVKIYLRPCQLSAQISSVIYQLIHSKSQIPPIGLQGPTGSGPLYCSPLPRHTGLLAIHWTLQAPFPLAIPSAWSPILFMWPVSSAAAS